jgi:hypothetical protein
MRARGAPVYELGTGGKRVLPGAIAFYKCLATPIDTEVHVGRAGPPASIHVGGNLVDGSDTTASRAKLHLGKNLHREGAAAAAGFSC